MGEHREKLLAGQVAALEAERDRLRGALVAIIHAADNDVAGVRAEDIARAALEGKP